MLLCLSSALSVRLRSSTSADYKTLRIGGLGFAVVLFTLGILLILSEFTCFICFFSCSLWRRQ